MAKQQLEQQRKQLHDAELARATTVEYARKIEQKVSSWHRRGIQPRWSSLHEYLSSKA